MADLDQIRLADALRRAAVRATRAPSVHNTQPWKLALGSDHLTIYADRGRQLDRHDPLARQLTISCGCALFNARVSLSADDVPIKVARASDGVGPTGPLALMWAVEAARSDQAAPAVLDKAIDSRRTNVDGFDPGDLPDELLQHLCAVADIEGGRLMLMAGPDECAFVQRQDREAAMIMALDPRYTAELRAWSVADGGGRTAEGGSGPSTSRQAALLITDQDLPADWLIAGEALERVLLEVTAAGYVAGLSSRLAEVPSVRVRIQRSLGLGGYPHLLIRLGSASPSPATRRRRLGEVIVHDG